MPRGESGLHEEPDLDARASAWHALDALVKDDLKLIAVQRGLSDSGTKQELIRLLVSDGLKSTDLTLEQLHRVAAHGAYAIAWFRVLPRSELLAIIARHNLPVDTKAREALPNLLHKELAKDQYRFPPLDKGHCSGTVVAAIGKQKSTGAAAAAAGPQRVATALAAYVKTHMAASPEAVADIVSQFATKLAMDPTSLTPRSVEATLQHSPRTAAATIMRT